MKRTNIIFLAVALFLIGFAAVGSYKLGHSQFSDIKTEGRPLIGGPFSLVDTNGRQVTDQDFHGKMMLVFFGYAHCPDVCPTELQTMAEVIEKLGQDADSVAPIFISVDPDRDTPEMLRNYVKAFNERIWGLTGDKNAVANVAKAYRVYYRKAGKGEDYSVDHSAFIYLMDQDGNYLTHFPFNSSPDAIVGVIKKHIPAGKNA